MTVIVVDSSVLAKYILREEGWEAARRVLASPGRLVTLDLAVKEVLNAIWKHAVLFKSFDAGVAREKAMLLERLVEEGVLELIDQSSLLLDAFSVALETGLTVYDSLFVVLARRESGVLATSDSRQARVASQLGVRVNLVA